MGCNGVTGRTPYTVKAVFASYLGQVDSHEDNVPEGSCGAEDNSLMRVVDWQTVESVIRLTVKEGEDDGCGRHAITLERVHGKAI